jgi:hypothetical protein
MPKAKALTWTQIKRHIQDFSQAGLLDIIHELYKANDLNKVFLTARFQPGATLESRELLGFKKQIHKYMCPNPTSSNEYFLNLKYGPARKIITNYKKTKDVLGTMDLMLTYVEAGNEFTQTYGDIDGPFYDSVCAMLDSFVKVFMACEDEAMPYFKERLQQLARDSQGIGWGYSDHVRETIRSLGL